jgi:hypothetical protein
MYNKGHILFRVNRSAVVLDSDITLLVLPPRLLMSWILVKKCIIFYIIVILKEFEMVKIYYGQFGQGILLLVKICTINLLIKNACVQFDQRILLLVKNCIINLSVKIYVRTVQSENIIVGKNLHNKITDKNFHGQLFIKNSDIKFIYR